MEAPRPVGNTTLAIAAPVAAPVAVIPVIVVVLPFLAFVILVVVVRAALTTRKSAAGCAVPAGVRGLWDIDESHCVTRLKPINGAITRGSCACRVADLVARESKVESSRSASCSVIR